MKKLSLDSRIKDLYYNPIGRDIFNKLLLQMNKKTSLIDNPIVGNLKLKTVAALTKSTLDKDFFTTLLRVLNSETDEPLHYNGKIKETWWKEAVIYQIYPRSFKDSNGDGIGDIRGIEEKLDYLKDLGVDVIWLSPIYDSPNDDNGYDIRDYYRIMNEFGTMEDFNRLINKIHEKGMKLIMDLVINHTSDEHQWFKDAINSKASKYKDYYIFKEGNKEKPPTNWTSFFSGSAWNYYDNIDAWGLHLFSKKQMDLNWENQDLRNEIYQMINWWLQKGIDGFRLDVINYISKEPEFLNGNESIGKLMGYYGIENYFYGPKLHEYLKEMRRETFDKYDVFTVGETPGIGMEMSKLLTEEERGELDMVFSFDQLETPGHVRFDDYKYDLNYLKEYLVNWMRNYGDNCWMTLFYENHDNPRMISKINPDPRYRIVLGKLLGMLQLTLKGTPFIYQGQELGLINKNFKTIEDLRDVESLNLYKELSAAMEKKAAFEKILAGTRDHARTGMPWDKSKDGGFTSGTPWIKGDEDFQRFNVEAELEDKDSVLSFYKELIAFRKAHKALIYGEFEVINEKTKNLFTFKRKLGEEVYFIECNLSSEKLKRFSSITEYKLILSNYKGTLGILRPYEVNLYKC